MKRFLDSFVNLVPDIKDLKIFKKNILNFEVQFPVGLHLPEGCAPLNTKDGLLDIYYLPGFYSFLNIKSWGKGNE